MSLLNKTATELSRLIREGEISSPELVRECLAAIKKEEPEVSAFITVCDEQLLLERADEVQKEIEAGNLTSPLAGVPVAVKDNICTKDIRTTCASRILSDFIPSYTATAVSRLEEAGALVIGKTNMDEFAMGSTSETSVFGSVKNPHDISRVPGGSSGGSAAAVAALEVPVALGSDTGGSIRQPSSYCGVTGIKPTYGTVSRFGLVAYGSSLDQIGPIAKSAADCAAVLEIISAHDKKDSTSLKRDDTDFTSALQRDVKGMRIGLPKAYFGDGLDTEVKEKILAAADVFKEQGAIVEYFDLDLTEYAVPAYYIIASAEASSNLSRFDGVKYGYRSEEGKDLHSMYKRTRAEGFGEEVKRRIMLGSFVLSSGYYEAYYMKALRTKALIKEAFDKAFEKYDIILGPAAPSTAPPLGESLKDPLQMYMSDIYTVPANLTGLPSMTVPCGKDAGGLPIGMMLTGRLFDEKALIRAAFSYEQGGDR